MRRLRRFSFPRFNSTITFEGKDSHVQLVALPPPLLFLRCKKFPYSMQVHSFLGRKVVLVDRIADSK